MPHARTLVSSLMLALLLSACGGDNADTMLASARDYLAKNDPKAAVIQLKNALQKNPDLPEARFLLGTALLRGGDPVGSETELRKALALKHPQELVLPPLAKAMLAQGQARKVTDEFGQVELSKPPAQAELKTILAAAYAAQGKADLSQAALTAALAADPDYGPALLVQARQKAVQKDFDGALSSVDAIIAKSPKDQDAWKFKGDVLLYGKDKPEDALVAYAKSVEVKPDYVEGHAALLTTMLRQGNVEGATKQLESLRKVSPHGVQTTYFDTLLAFRAKDYKHARELAQQLMKVAPNSLLSLQLAGAIELQFKSLVQAEAYLTKALSIAPQSPLVRRLLTVTYLQSSQPAKALTVMEPMLKADNQDSAVNAMAGEVYLRNGDVAKAEEYFGKAAKQDPKNTRARTALALTHMAGGQADAGLAELQSVAASDSGVSADLAIIATELRRKEFDKALKAIDALEKKQPDKPLASNLRGRTLLAKQDMAGARKSFERSVAIDPMYFPSVASLAALDLADKKPDEARKRFEAVLAKDPKNGQALLAMAELRARTGAPKEEVADLIGKAVSANPTDKGPRLLLIDFHLRNKDFKPALSAAQNAVAAIPDSPELLDALGRAQQASGEMNQALNTYNKVAAMQPLSPAPQLRLAQANMAAKDTPAATQSLKRALEIKPDLLEAQAALISLAIESKNFTEATNIARTVQKQRPKEPTGYIFEGDVAVKQAKWDAAADAYRAGLKAAPSPALAIKLNATLAGGGKAAEADKFSESWLKDHPKDMAYRLYLGDSATAHKNYPVAEKMYVSVIQIQPDNPVALNNLAWVSAKMNKEGAIGYAEKAIALAPNQPAFMDTLAMLLSDKNDYPKALEWQNKAIALQPENALYKLNLAKIYIKGGKKDLARKELDELAKLGDKFAGQSEVAGLLKTL
ncbi:MAG: XrtA/PEP-CTERM system TPR-repeat protein PrsT [Burkholderiaceae bacterium]